MLWSLGVDVEERAFRGDAYWLHYCQYRQAPLTENSAFESWADRGTNTNTHIDISVKKILFPTQASSDLLTNCRNKGNAE